MREALLAIDLGTTSLKAVLVDPDGVSLDRDSVQQEGTPTVAGWMDALVTVMTSLRERQPEIAVAALAITGQMHGTQRYDRDGQPIGHCQIWTDRSAAPHLPALLERAGPGLPLRIGSTIAPGYQALNLFVDEDLGRLSKVLLPKDTLIHALTGRFVTDPSDAAGTGLFDGGTGTWAWEIVDALGIPRELLPEVVPSGTVVGTVRDRIAGIDPGTPVIIAGGDTPVAACGAGTAGPSDVQLMLSTSAQVLNPTDAWQPHPTAMWYTWPAASPTGARWLRSGTMSNGGAVIDWLASIQGRVEVTEIAPTPIVVLPHLAGRRFPAADAAVSGAMIGLRGTHTREDLYRALLQGIAYSFREVYDAMMAERPAPARIRFGGGGSSIPGFARLLATVLGVSLERIAGSDLTCDGAAIIAAHTLGWTPKVPAEGEMVEPDHEARERFNAIYAIYRDANAAALPISHRLSALG